MKENKISQAAQGSNLLVEINFSGCIGNDKYQSSFPSSIISPNSVSLVKIHSKIQNQKVKIPQANKKCSIPNPDLVKWCKNIIYRRKNKLSFIKTAITETIKFILYAQADLTANL